MYLLKFIICSFILYAFYHWILRNERLFSFNRFFLLSIVVLSTIIPLIIVRTQFVEVASAVTWSQAGQLSVDNSEIQGHGVPNVTVSTVNLFLCLSGIISIFLLSRFVRNLLAIRQYRKGGELTFYKGTKVILRTDTQQSFSFLNHIYPSSQCYLKDSLPDEILEHEKAHVDQKHSYDILFIELAICLLWFNPALYLIRKAIKLNHEFLADEAAIAETGSLVQYQNIIIQFASRQIVVAPALASHLSFGETKKRIKIMVKTRNKTTTITKQTLAMVIIAFLFISLGETKIIAQERKSDNKVITTPVPFLVKKDKKKKETLKVQDQKKRPEPPMLISVIPRSTSKVRYTNSQGKRVTAIFGELSDQIRKDFADLKLNGEVWMEPKPKADLSQEMLDDFKNAEKYGVWIDGSKVDNTVLNRYRPEDFHHFFKSKLGKGAKNYGEYTYHLALVTQKTFEKVPTNLTGMWIKYSEQVARARKFLDPVEEKN